MLRSTALAAILFALSLAPAMAQTPIQAAQSAKPSAAGDWNATLVTPQRTLTLGFSIRQDSPGKFSGTMGSHDNGVWDCALSDIVLNGDTLSFSVADSGAKFKGKWEAGAWSGTYSNPAGTFPLKLSPGAVPPLPTIAGLDGRWEGTLSVQGLELKIVLRTKTDAHGTATLMDSPTQGANGIPTSGLKREADAVSFNVPSIRGVYTGRLAADGASLAGSWSQMGQNTPLILARVSDSAELKKTARPQTPKAPFPYKSEDVAYDNPKAPGVGLACTLTQPETGAPHPAAILITGSGGQDRNETLIDHQVFGVLADHLTRKGIAVLRCDDRGIAKSTGVFLNATPKDFATDVEAGLAFLRTRPGIDPKRIGLIGHSEGSVTGPQVVVNNPDVAFLVMMGGLGAKGIDVMTEQRTLITLAMGMPAEQAPMIRMGSNMLYAAAIGGDEAAATEAVANLLVVSSMGAITLDAAKETAKEFTSPYMRDLLSYDPAPVLSKITIPVLAITGGKDLQVPPKQNLPVIKSLMANNPDVTTVEIPGLNHLFQTATTGAPSEYGEIEETFAPAALDEISNWIVTRMKP